MIVEVPDAFFKDVKKQFNELDTSTVDEQMKDMLDYFKTSPCLFDVVPRWSCAGHSDESGDDSFYIIFCTIGDGADFLLSVFDEISKRMMERFGTGYLACTRLTIVNLLHQNHPGTHNHLKLETMTQGDSVLTTAIKKVWFEVLDELTWEYYES